MKVIRNLAFAVVLCLGLSPVAVMVAAPSQISKPIPPKIIPFRDATAAEVLQHDLKEYEDNSAKKESAKD